MNPNDWKPIVLSAKAFGHLSQGLYRTPAGAIKELISNSFDADAVRVRIHTDFPRFQSFSCEDTGGGMLREEFDRLMKNGIGNSAKRSDEEHATTPSGRPYIGRLGLGILALAQICDQFDIISHHQKTKSAFSATIKFPPYARQQIDKVAATAVNSKNGIKGGEFQVHEIPFESGKPGLRIFTSHLRESFQKRMRNLENYGNRTRRKGAIKDSPYPTFDKFLDAIYDRTPPVQSLNLLSDYDQLLFGLALAAPLPFPLKRNVTLELAMIAEREAQIASYKFDVLVDNLAMSHPLCLPSDKEQHTAADCIVGPTEPLSFGFVDATKFECAVLRRSITFKASTDRFNLYEFVYDKSVAGRPLKFSGYLFQQTGRLYPREIQGILIRINNVAIGKYDNSMLAYPYAEGPRYAMVSGELFVEAGFEDALNIDRDSFNELHPHYIRVQKYIHGLLHQLIFPETWSEEKGRNKAKRDTVREQSETKFVSGFSSTTGERYKAIRQVLLSNSVTEATAAKTPPVIFEPTKREIRVDRQHPLLKAILRKIKYASMMERIAIAFERASLETTSARRRDLFYKLLLEIVTSL